MQADVRLEPQPRRRVFLHGEPVAVGQDDFRPVRVVYAQRRVRVRVRGGEG